MSNDTLVEHNYCLTLINTIYHDKIAVSNAQMPPSRTSVIALEDGIHSVSFRRLDYPRQQLQTYRPFVGS